MNSLGFNFIKRAFIVPITITLVVVLIMLVAVPKFMARTQAKEATASNIDMSTFTTVEYNNFKTLEVGDYVGKISCEDLGINSVITYSLDSSSNTVLLNEISKEPWNNGCVVLNGANVTNQFKNLHNAKIGDEFTVEFYGRDKYTYKITDISYGNTKKDIPSFKKANTLVMCLAYNNFEDLGNLYYYSVYVAQMV
jgi:sortase (surface protein transpeptidase)